MPPGYQYYCWLLLHAYTNYAKMLQKETETEETWIFTTFLSLVAFRLGGGGEGGAGPTATPMGDS